MKSSAESSFTHSAFEPQPEAIKFHYHDVLEPMDVRSIEFIEHKTVPEACQDSPCGSCIFVLRVDHS